MQRAVLPVPSSTEADADGAEDEVPLEQDERAAAAEQRLLPHAAEVVGL